MIEVNINKEEKVKIKRYPYIGMYQEIVVLFCRDSEGTVLNHKDISIGAYRTDWDESLFKPLEGEITLRNF